MLHRAPPIGGPTKSYCRKSSILRVAPGHMIVSGWKTSTWLGLGLALALGLGLGCAACDPNPTPKQVPLVYTRHTARFLSMWLLLLPLGLYDTFGNSWNHLGLLPAVAVMSNPNPNP